MTIDQLFSLKGKTAVVTGGGRGLGRYMAIALAEAGADLVLISRNQSTLYGRTYGVDIGRSRGRCHPPLRDRISPFPVGTSGNACDSHCGIMAN